MASVSIQHLRKEFDESIVAVDDITLKVHDGEFLVIVGPSGCGKSTTLNMIAGLESPTSGEILIGDEDVTGDKPQERDIAMVFQSYALYPHMDVRGNIGFGLKMRTDQSEDEVNSRIEEVSRLLEIEDLLDKAPRDLSGGQRQRVALGRAIARDPEVFLMDEPLSNLDAKLRTQMRTELQDLQQKLGVTTIYVTHDQTEAMTMSDRIAILNDGQLQQIGTPMECYHQPANKFVAGFIGSPSMNFISVTTSEDGLETSSFSYTLTEQLRSQLPEPGTDVDLGVRPENLSVHPDPVENGIEAEVNVVEPMGDVTNVYVNIDGVKHTATVAGNFTGSPGDTVYVHFPEEHLYLFDGQSGEALIERVIPEGEAEQPRGSPVQ